MRLSRSSPHCESEWSAAVTAEILFMNFLHRIRPDLSRETRVFGHRYTVALGVVALSIVASGVACGQAPRLIAPNVVEISPRLVTSGQPSAEALAGLKAMAFDAVIYLAPPTVSDAVRDE